jgi:16S rRNA (guanine966-N2)-methyltransferase
MRVIAGHLGGRSLVAPRGLATRPTTDRVREALFSILGDVRGARVLDLYAGTGALGIEALSRGAASCVMVESARPALAALRRNIGDLGLAGATRVLAEPAARAAARLLSEPSERFDLVFADPPYEDAGAALDVLETLAPALNPSARVVLEHAARSPPQAKRHPSRLRHLRTRLYGDTALAFFDAPSADGHTS